MLCSVAVMQSPTYFRAPFVLCVAQAPSKATLQLSPGARMTRPFRRILAGTLATASLVAASPRPRRPPTRTRPQRADHLRPLRGPHAIQLPAGSSTRRSSSSRSARSPVRSDHGSPPAPQLVAGGERYDLVVNLAGVCRPRALQHPRPLGEPPTMAVRLVRARLIRSVDRSLHRTCDVGASADSTASRTISWPCITSLRTRWPMAAWPVSRALRSCHQRRLGLPTGSATTDVIMR